jgi:hypothetical protein
MADTNAAPVVFRRKKFDFFNVTCTAIPAPA